MIITDEIFSAHNIYIMRYTKYKTHVRLSIFGDDDLSAANTDSQYKTGSNYTNGKRCRFTLNGAFNDLILSKNATIIMEATYMPTITNMNNYVIVRLVTSTEDRSLDTKKFTAGNPILITFKGTNQQIYNCTEFFYNMNIPSNFLTKGYVDIEIESPVATQKIDFITSSPLNSFFITFVIVDEDDDETMDPKLRPEVDLSNFGRLGQPIRKPIGLLNYF